MSTLGFPSSDFGCEGLDKAVADHPASHESPDFPEIPMENFVEEDGEPNDKPYVS